MHILSCDTLCFHDDVFKKFHMHNKSYAYLIVWFLALHDEGFKDLITQTFHMHYSSYA